MHVNTTIAKGMFSRLSILYLLFSFHVNKRMRQLVLRDENILYRIYIQHMSILYLL